MLAQYADNSAYSTVASANLFIQACRLLIVNIPTRASSDGLSSDRGEGYQANLKSEIAEAKLFVSENSANSNAVRYIDNRDFRR